MGPWIPVAGVVALVFALLSWSDDGEQSSGYTVLTRPRTTPVIPENPGPWTDQVWSMVLSAILTGIPLNELMSWVFDTFPESFGSAAADLANELAEAYPVAENELGNQGLIPPEPVVQVVESQRRRQRRREQWAGAIGIVAAAAAAIVGAIATPAAGAAVAAGGSIVSGLLLADWSSDAGAIVADVGSDVFELAQQWVAENPEWAAYQAAGDLYLTDPDAANQLAEQA